MKFTQAQIRQSILTLNRDCEFRNRLNDGDDEETAKASADRAAKKIKDRWERRDAKKLLKVR